MLLLEQRDKKISEELEGGCAAFNQDGVSVEFSDRKFSSYGSRLPRVTIDYIVNLQTFLFRSGCSSENGHATKLGPSGW